MKDTPENRRKLAAKISGVTEPVRHDPPISPTRNDKLRAVRKLRDDERRPAALKALDEIARRERGLGKQAITISLTMEDRPITNGGLGGSYVKTAEQINAEYAQLADKRTDEAVEAIVTVVNALGLNPYKKRRRGRSGFGISIPLPGPFRWGKSF